MSCVSFIVGFFVSKKYSYSYLFRLMLYCSLVCGGWALFMAIYFTVRHKTKNSSNNKNSNNNKSTMNSNNSSSENNKNTKSHSSNTSDIELAIVKDSSTNVKNDEEKMASASTDADIGCDNNAMVECDKAT